MPGFGFGHVGGIVPFGGSGFSSSGALAGASSGSSSLSGGGFGGIGHGGGHDGGFGGGHGEFFFNYLLSTEN